MKRILGIAMVLSMVGALSIMAQEVKPGKTGIINLGKDVKLEMVFIPAGKFKMGSPASEFGRGKFETQHEVTLTKPFFMGKYEVTQEQWEAVMGNNPSGRSAIAEAKRENREKLPVTKGAKLPVTDVSWEDCQEFIKKLNENTKGGYRLPTEAEWEYACRAGTSTAYSFGDSLIEDLDRSSPGNRLYKDAHIRGTNPVAVGGYRPNAFGLYDMHGNVKEWCEDWYDYYPEGAAKDPKGPVEKEMAFSGRVQRGGGFQGGSGNRSARSSLRENGSDYLSSWDLGFRLARTADSKNSVASPTETKPAPLEKMPATGNLLVAPFTEAKEIQKEVAKSLKKEVEEKEDLGKDVKLEMVFIPGGKFKMGSPESEKGRDDIETEHEVTLTKPFYMGKYEVTQEQWESVMGKNPSDTKGAKLPVTDVSWEDCQEFIKKLNENTKGGYRLPTEAEWEYACRAGTTTAYSFGDKIIPKDANYDSRINKSVEVGSYKPNAFGLFEMHGNVWEWCEDWFGAYPEGALTDPKGPATGERRVLRGGSFNLGVSFARSSIRYDFSPSNRFFLTGFRLARTS